MKRTTSLLLVAAIGLWASTALAWNKAGHMVTGAIAYTQLKKTDPTALAEVLRILESHPEYPDWEQYMDHVDPDIRERLLFMLAARWPDDARGGSHDRPKWHYINFPFSVDGTPTTPLPTGDDIYVGYRMNLEMIRGMADDEEKAIAICWLLHLVGDVHQPLHVVELFSTNFRSGDNGGTKCYIKPTNHSEAMSLHQFWDGLVQGSERSRYVGQKADMIIAMHPATPAALPDLVAFEEDDFAEKWAEEESLKLAQESAYKFNSSLLTLERSRSDAKPLPAGYSGAVQPLAYKRAALAGYRLAALLGAEF